MTENYEILIRRQSRFRSSEQLVLNHRASVLLASPVAATPTREANLHLVTSRRLIIGAIARRAIGGALLSDEIYTSHTLRERARSS